MRAMKGLAAAVLAALATTAQAAPPPPSFSKDVQPFLTKYCVECHGNKKAKAKLNFTSYESLMRGAKKKPVVPGKPEDSLLIRTMESRGKKKMPPPKYKSQPTAEEIAVIKAWVQAGAKDDSGAGAASTPPEPGEAAVESLPIVLGRRDGRDPQPRVSLHWERQHSVWCNFPTGTPAPKLAMPGP